MAELSPLDEILALPQEPTATWDVSERFHPIDRCRS